MILRGGARPPTQAVVAFIDANRDVVVEGRRLGVEPICSVLEVAPSTYYAAKARAPSARQVRDTAMRVVVRQPWEDNYRVYGARKIDLTSQEVDSPAAPPFEQEGSEASSDGQKEVTFGFVRIRPYGTSEYVSRP
jgi:hypothetical protein